MAGFRGRCPCGGLLSRGVTRRGIRRQSVRRALRAALLGLANAVSLRLPMHAPRYRAACPSCRAKSRVIRHVPAAAGDDAESWARRIRLEPDTFVLTICTGRQVRRRDNVATCSCAIGTGNGHIRRGGRRHGPRGGPGDSREDLLASTGRQLQLAALLGRTTPPLFLHHTLLVHADGSKLSKANHDTALRELRQAGMSAASLLGEAAVRAGLLSTYRTLHAADVPALFSA